MSDGEATTARLGEGSSAPRLAGPTAERQDSEAAMRRTWQGQRLSGASRRQPRTTPHRPNGRSLGGDRLVDKSDSKRNEWIERSGRATFLRNEGAWVIGLAS